MKSLCWLLLLLPILPLSPLRAEQDCTLKLLADLDLLDSPGGTPVVPVIFNGRQAKMTLDTGAYWSGIVPSAAAGLKSKPLRYIAMIGAGGGTMRTAVTTPAFQIGRLSFSNADFFVFAREDSNDPDLIGNIGANLLKPYDVEIDYAGRKVKLYRQEHCPGKVVTWRNEGIVEIPFKLNDVGHISLPVAIDGHQYTALLDTGATASYLDKKVADRDFGLTAETANAMGTSDTLDGKALPTFYHRFDSFEFGGLQFKRPQLAFSTGQENSRKSGWEAERIPDIILGMHQLRSLHFYIAYGEKKIYASVASQLAPLDPIDRQTIAEFTEAARKSFNERDFPAAAASLTQASRIGPKEAWIYTARASAYQQAGDLPSAIADLDEAIRLDPQAPEAVAGRCAVKLQASRFDEAFADCQQALTLDAKNHQALLGRAFLYLRRQQLDEATADCNAVLADDPQSAPALAYLDQIRQFRAALSAQPVKPGPKTKGKS